MSLQHVPVGRSVPVDVNVIIEIPMHSPAMGLLRMEDEAGDDAKVLAVPVTDITGLCRDVRRGEDSDALLRMQIEHFFSHYKDLERGKWVKVKGWEDADAARQEIVEAVACYETSPDRPNF